MKPPRLQQGDTVGIVTLGSPLATSRINQGIANLKSRGYEVIVGEHVYSVNGYLAATPEQRASDLMKMFENKDVKWILPARGGVGVAGILPYLDFSIISQNPKIVSGYSDITVLLNVLYEYAQLVTFQSLLLIDFHSSTPNFNFEQLFRCYFKCYVTLANYEPTWYGPCKVWSPEMFRVRSRGESHIFRRYFRNLI